MSKHLCACGCNGWVSRKTEARHQNGQGPSLLTSSVLTQSQSLLRSHGQGSQTRRKVSSCRSAKQEVVGRSGTLRRTLSLRLDPADRFSPIEESDNPVSEHRPSPSPTYQNGDFPMGEAGPSGVAHDTPEPGMPFPEPTHVDDARNHDCYGLSKLRRSHRIAECVDRIGRQWWGPNHVRQFIVDDKEGSEEESEEEAEGVMDGEEYLNGEDDFQEEEEDATPGAEPGQEGISVWDLLGESFLKEASKLGQSSDFFLYYQLMFSQRVNSWMRMICPSFVPMPLKSKMALPTRHSTNFTLPSPRLQ